MTEVTQNSEFTSYIKESFQNHTFVNLSLGNYKGTDENLKNIYAKRILIKNQEKLSFTYRYKTRDIVKNYDLTEAVSLIAGFLNTGFRLATLFTTKADFHLEKTGSGKVILKKKNPVNETQPSAQHDKEKSRLIPAKNKSYLTELKITDAEGTVFKNAQDKYRQINHYVEILSSLIKEIPTFGNLKVVDMGSGKGYLTFALYDYLHNVLDVDADVTGVEFRQDMVELCNSIAEKSSFKNLHFEEGTIDAYDSTDTNILIALHACDTATDDAIFKGITAGADLIVVAPCCHKQIRREIEKNKTTNDVDFLTKYGIFLERQAEMVTDGIRAMILEYYGYKTKVFEFISDVHTPKNVMIVGIKNKKASQDQQAILQKIKDAKAYFGIGYHHLEKIAQL
ncbi:class I SAM-dependent methyltransferase [Dyadobacter psychrotolerans]|uniref:SAM-dependent methyltransferase n=1 Tax=Dyadobacter psychrotolerans TaxID=2541721 RepID=A0A4R5DPI9_9BACT|nr:SAM-dependent methyltransferase [Dyadobacter psychrotolerans]TDE15497.1 SAM-dependent methyltransferase [Dyadobacter psychrotolerans]